MMAYADFNHLVLPADFNRRDDGPLRCSVYPGET